MSASSTFIFVLISINSHNSLLLVIIYSISSENRKNEKGIKNINVTIFFISMTSILYN